MAAIRVWTIGHSNHSVDRLIDLLKQHDVQVIADVRSHPYSKYASQFDSEPLTKALRDSGFQYVFLGAELGGRPRGDEFYDAEGHVLYDQVAGSPAFLGGIARLENGAVRHRVALLCAEEDPSGCHRRLLVGRVLIEREVEVIHIRGDGRLQTEEDLSASEPRSSQMSFFEELEPPEWKSIPSVSHKKRQSSSSAF